jgi:hypothetical protein
MRVRYRLVRYGAGRCMDYATSTPDVIADAIATEIERVPAYRPVATDGARRAAELIAAAVAAPGGRRDQAEADSARSAARLARR